jgi:hypothetical protein
MLGVRFPDMSEAYNREMIFKAEAAAKRNGIKISAECTCWTGPHMRKRRDKIYGLIGAMHWNVHMPKLFTANYLD